MKRNYDPDLATASVIISELSRAGEGAQQVSLTGRIQIGFTPYAP